MVGLKEEAKFLILPRTHREERGLKVAIKCSPDVSWNSSPANFLAPTEEIGNGGQRTTRRRKKIMGYRAPTQRTPEFEWSSLCFSDVWRRRGKALRVARFWRWQTQAIALIAIWPAGVMVAFALLPALLEVAPETPANSRSTGNLWQRLLICCRRSWPPHKLVALKLAALDSAAPQRGSNRGAMASSETNSNEVSANPVNSNSSGEPELHLLLAPDTFEPLWKSLFRQMDEFFFPVQLPPLALKSKPEPVRDLWGFYNHKKDGVLGSTAVHILIAGIIIAGTVTWTPPKTQPPRKPTVVLVSPSDIPLLQPGK